MKVYVYIECLGENGDKDFDYKLFRTLDEAKQHLELRNKELYRIYQVDRHTETEGISWNYTKAEKYADYYDDWGDYHLAIDEREV